MLLAYLFWCKTLNSAHRQAVRGPGGYWRPLQDPLHLSFGTFALLVSPLPRLTSPQHKNATENDLRREFESFGSIERVRVVRDKNGRSRGYAFIVFDRERDMKGNTSPPRFVLTHPASVYVFALASPV